MGGDVKLFLSAGLLTAALMMTGPALARGPVQRTSTGIIVTPAEGPEKAVRLQVYGDAIVRVTAAPTAELNLPDSLMVIAEPVSSGFTVEEGDGTVAISTSKVRATVDLNDGNVRFYGSDGQLDLGERGAGAFAPVEVEGHRFLATHQ